MTVLTAPTKGSDVVKWESHPGYTRISRKITNTDTADGAPQDIPSPIGQTVGGTLAVPTLMYNGDEANAIGVIVSGPAIEQLADDGVTPDEYGILVRGNSLIAASGLDTLDPDGDTLVQATLKTALEALGIIYMDESGLSSTQTT